MEHDNLNFRCNFYSSDGEQYSGIVKEKIKELRHHYDDSSKFVVNIIVCKIRDFRKPHFLPKISGKISRHTSDPLDGRGKSKKEEKYAPLPVILIGLQNLFDEEIQSAFNIDQKFRFWDSNIWQRYICFDGNFEDNFLSAVRFIKRNHDLHLYETTVAKEYLEFQTRLYLNSYLPPINKGGHATDVTPFKFHLETKMKEKADEFIDNKDKKIDLTKFSWRILLLDDFACEWKDEKGIVHGKLKIDETYSGPTKYEVLKNILNLQKCDWIEIKTCNSISDFVSKISSKEDGKIFDIILLDYLLGENTIGQSRSREYSIEILKWIKDELLLYLKDEKLLSIDTVSEINNYNPIGIINYNCTLKGPLRKFWFFPISVFSYAFLEDIRQMGYTQYDDDWVIARGADPVNTPELFRYSLFKLMEAQLNDAGIESVNEGLNENNFLTSFLFKLFDNSLELTEEKLKENYKKFLDKKQNFVILYNNYKKDSLFAKSVLKVSADESELKAFYNSLDHLHHLYYLIAFTSPYEWPMMRAEYDRIETEYANQGINITNHPLWEKVYKLIKDYRETAGSR